MSGLPPVVTLAAFRALGRWTRRLRVMSSSGLSLHLRPVTGLIAIPGCWIIRPGLPSCHSPIVSRSSVLLIIFLGSSDLISRFEPFAVRVPVQAGTSLTRLGGPMRSRRPHLLLRRSRPSEIGPQSILSSIGAFRPQSMFPQTDKYSLVEGALVEGFTSDLSTQPQQNPRLHPPVSLVSPVMHLYVIV